MKKMIPSLTLGLLAACLFACTPKADDGAPENGGDPGDTGTPETTPPTTEAAVPGTATVKGKVLLKGTAPVMPELRGLDGTPECADQHDTPPKAEVVVTGEGGSLGNCFVYVSKGVSGRYPTPTEPVKFDQKKCLYTPHVIGAQVGQTVEISNSDPLLHNVHILASPALKEMNKAQPKGTPALTLKFRKPALGVSVKCDVHPWMQAYACVSAHPFFGVTGPDGAFEFPEKLPAGTYTITAWHEKFGTSDQEVTLADSETKEINLEIEAK